MKNREKKLSKQEREVLRLLAEGFSSQEVCHILNVSRGTIGTHRHRIMLKLGINEISGLVKYALREGLTNLEQHNRI